MRTLNCIKIIQWFVFINILLFGCKVRKDKSTETRVQHEIEGRVNGTTSYIHWLNIDSTLRYWSYTSDSNFLFHPNDGLWGQSGKLEYLERNIVRIKGAKGRLTYDSTGVTSSEEVNNSRINQTKYVWSNWVWLLGIGFIMIGIYCFHIKK